MSLPRVAKFDEHEAALDRAHLLPWRPDGHVGEAVGVEVAGGQGVPEQVARFVGRVELGLVDVATVLQPCRGTEQEPHHPRLGGPDRLAGGADGQVGEGVLVEVTGRQRPTELVAGLVGRAHVGLGVPGAAGAEPARGAVEHRHRAPGHRADLVVVGPDGQVGEPVLVEVGRGDRAAPLGPGHRGPPGRPARRHHPPGHGPRHTRRQPRRRPHHHQPGGQGGRDSDPGQ
jgi:hypothetical protein